MPSKTATASFDTESNASLATTNYALAKTIKLQSSPVHNGFFYFVKPFPATGATIISATLTLYQQGVAAGGTRTLTVQRVSKAWTESKLNHSNQPTVTGATATSVLGNGGVDGRAWVFDVQPLLAQVASGGVWFGFKVTSNVTTALAMFSKNNTLFRPTLSIQWSTPPATPSNIHPSNGRAVSIARPTITFGGATLDATIGSYRLELNTSDVWTTPAYDSGQVFSAVPEHALTSDVAANVLQYGRVMVWGPDGVASAWSATFTFIRTAKGTLSITFPAASPNNFVNDATPPIAATFSGTLVKYQAFVTDPNNAAKVYWDSGVVPAASIDFTLPEKVLTAVASLYRLTLRAQDNVSREGTPGDPVYVQAQRDFTFELSNTVSPVTGLTITSQPLNHLADATWTSATTPDYFRLFVNGSPVGGYIDPLDVYISGTSYAMTLANLKPDLTQTVTIARVVNKVVSSGNPSISITPNPEGIWLSGTDGSNPVCISNGEVIGTWDTTEISDVVQGINATYPALITQTLGAKTGSVTGVLTDQVGIPGVSIATWESRANALANPAGQLLRLALTNTNIAVRIYKVNIDPAEEHGDIGIAFSFIQQADA